MHLKNLTNVLIAKMIAHSPNNNALSVVNTLMSLAGCQVAQAHAETGKTIHHSLLTGPVDRRPCVEGWS
jgi:hypothetical protein